MTPLIWQNKTLVVCRKGECFRNESKPGREMYRYCDSEKNMEMAIIDCVTVVLLLVFIMCGDYSMIAGKHKENSSRINMGNY